MHNKDAKQITFLDERYYFDNKTATYHPSATTILNVYPKGHGFMQWLKDLGSNADQVVQRAQDQGTKIHEAIEDFLNGKEVKWCNEAGEANYTLQEWMMIMRFHEFYTTYKPENIAVEAKLVSSKLDFGGTLDYVCRLPDFPGEVWYIDWKTGNAIYKTNKLQGAAYQQLWNELKRFKITRLGCMHLNAKTRGADKKGKKIQGKGWRLEEIDDPQKYFTLFKHTQELWKEENPNPKPKNLIYPDSISKK